MYDVHGNGQREDLLVLWAVFTCHLMSTEDLCNGRPEVADTSDVNGDSAPVPTRYDCGLVFLGGPLMTCVSWHVFSTKVTAYASWPDVRICDLHNWNIMKLFLVIRIQNWVPKMNLIFTFLFWEVFPSKISFTMQETYYFSFYTLVSEVYQPQLCMHL